MYNLKDLDIIYIVKDTKYNGELRHSLRSVAKNFPHRNILFAGGLPEGLVPDGLIKVEQNEGNKYDNVHKVFEAINRCYQDGMENREFVIFNDDFFVLKPIKELPPYINGRLSTLKSNALKNNHNQISRYTIRLDQIMDGLKRHHLTSWNFELHIPMIYNADLLNQEFERMNDRNYQSRSTYGNMFYKRKDCIARTDVKIYDKYSIPEPDQDFVSTTDESFNQGKVGKYLREMFSEPCEYEV